MKLHVTVFDFDKTLTDRDTLFGFYKAVGDSKYLIRLKQMLLISAGIFYKAGVIKNTTLKKIGIALFLRGKTKDQLETAAQIYASQINLNGIYYDHYQKTVGDKWIVSASPEIYLKHIFPGEKVAGTTLKFHDRKVVGLGVNMFGCEKKRFLKEKGVHHISEFYTDSMSDRALMEMAETVYIIKNGTISHLKPPCNR